MKYFISIITFLFIIGCSGRGTSITNQKIDIDELIKSPTNLQIDSKNFSISIYLWRDYMPISPPLGHPMRASIDIIASDSLLFPKNIEADKMWVFDSLEIWESVLLKDTPPEDYILSKRASGGPLWETGIFVDVVVRLVQDDSIYHYLKAENIEIHRTD